MLGTMGRILTLLSVNPAKWLNILKQRRKLPTNFLSVFDYFIGLALKGLNCEGPIFQFFVFPVIFKEISKSSCLQLNYWKFPLSEVEAYDFT